ncbi:MAG: PIN domain-containing protein [Candidatus Nomurabacteria bacterium]|jgi:predicted nucleic acid-binding protein|nr:PIN domain-containing protein [Candidatus Nomurabacteria bacterium]
MKTVGRAFVDTNVLLYQHDRSEPQKRRAAMRLVRKLVEDDNLYISAQVLNEFISAGSKKLKLTKAEIVYALEEMSKLNVLEIDAGLVKNAAGIHFTHRISYYDSLIVAAAIKAGCDVLYSEDMNGGQTIDGLKVVNPFI